jgi:phytoene/squalene synthetase
VVCLELGTDADFLAIAGGVAEALGFLLVDVLLVDKKEIPTEHSLGLGLGQRFLVCYSRVRGVLQIHL